MNNRFLFENIMNKIRPIIENAVSEQEKFVDAKFDEFAKLIKSNPKNTYYNVVYKKTGEKQRLRLFVYNNGEICYYLPRKTTRGYILIEKGDKYSHNAENYEITPITKTHKSDLEKARYNLNKMITMLNNSGLWESDRKVFEFLNSLDDEELGNVLAMDWSEINEYLKSNNMSWNYGEDIKGIVIYPKIKTLNLDRYERDEIIENIDNALKTKSDYSYRWYKGYDNSVSVQHSSDGNMRGWYSEEYRGCGNGHYYILLDKSHALFSEDD